MTSIAVAVIMMMMTADGNGPLIEITFALVLFGDIEL